MLQIHRKIQKYTYTHAGSREMTYRN